MIQKSGDSLCGEIRQKKLFSTHGLAKLDTLTTRDRHLSKLHGP